MQKPLLVAALLALAAAIAALSILPAKPARGSNTIQVVAAENFWGSIAAQLGGSRVHVTSVVANPATDPHDYEPTAADARTIAGAQLAIVNGVGYDPWASKLLAASPSKSRVVLDVGKLVGVGTGGNPHRWYSPANVQQVIAATVAGLSKLDPKDARYFRSRRRAFERDEIGRAHV